MKTKKYYLVAAIGSQTGEQQFKVQSTSMKRAVKELEDAGYQVIRIIESATTRP